MLSRAYREFGSTVRSVAAPIRFRCRLHLGIPLDRFQLRSAPVLHKRAERVTKISRRRWVNMEQCCACRGGSARRRRAATPLRRTTRCSATPVSYSAVFPGLRHPRGRGRRHDSQRARHQARDHFVALPSRRALSPKGTKTYGVKVCADNGKCETAPVWDLGPWNTTDDCWSPPAVLTCLEAVEAWGRARRRDGVLIRLRAASTLGVREAAAWSLPGRRS
jgi:hypothetical protein